MALKFACPFSFGHCERGTVDVIVPTTALSSISPDICFPVVQKISPSYIIAGTRTFGVSGTALFLHPQIPKMIIKRINNILYFFITNSSLKSRFMTLLDYINKFQLDYNIQAVGTQCSDRLVNTSLPHIRMAPRALFSYITVTDRRLRFRSASSSASSPPKEQSIITAPVNSIGALPPWPVLGKSPRGISPLPAAVFTTLSV